MSKSSTSSQYDDVFFPDDENVYYDCNFFVQHVMKPDGNCFWHSAHFLSKMLRPDISSSSIRRMFPYMDTKKSVIDTILKFVQGDEASNITSYYFV